MHFKKTLEVAYIGLKQDQILNLLSHLITFDCYIRVTFYDVKLYVLRKINNAYQKHG